MRDNTAAVAAAPDEPWRRVSNKPPREIFTERVKELVGAVNAWAANRRIRTEEEASKCADLLDQLLKERQALKNQRREEKKPFEDAAAEAQLFYANLEDVVGAAEGILHPLKGAWLRLKQAAIDEEKRLAAEAAAKAAADAEAARKAAEETTAGDAVERQVAANDAAQRAAEAAAAAQRAATAKAQVHGEVGGKASGFRTVWTARIDDWPKAAIALSAHPAVRDAIQRVANAAARSTKSATKIDGVTPISRQEV